MHSTNWVVMGDVQTTYTAECAKCGAIHAALRPDTTTAGIAYPESYRAECNCTDPPSEILMEKTVTDGRFAEAMRAVRALRG